MPFFFSNPQISSTNRISSTFLSSVDDQPDMGTVPGTHSRNDKEILFILLWGWHSVVHRVKGLVIIHTLNGCTVIGIHKDILRR